MGFVSVGKRGYVNLDLVRSATIEGEGETLKVEIIYLGPPNAGTIAMTDVVAGADAEAVARVIRESANRTLKEAVRGPEKRPVDRR